MTYFYNLALRQMKPLCAVLSILLVILTTSPTYAEGSKELAANGGYRAYMNSTTTASTVNLFPTQGTMKVYAKVGERIYVGSSAQGIGNGTIILKAPNGTTYTTGTSTLVGRISNRTQEVNGPNVVTGVGLGYNAGIFTVGAGQEGVWEVTFISPNASNATNPTAYLASAAWTQPSSAFIAAFDISVYDGSAFKTGRVFTNIFTGNLGGYANGFNAIFYVLTKDGYRYTVNNNGQTGFGFTFFVNNKGHRNANNAPSYLSINDLSTVNIKDPRTADTESDVTHKIFFNPVNADVPASASAPNSTTEWLVATPPTLIASNITFTGVEGTPNTMGTNPAGGNIGFTSNANGNYAVDIDVNRNGVYTDAVDRRLTGTAINGANSIFWDGKDGQGNKVAAFTSATTAINIRVVLFGGEVHFPFIDVENNVNGIVITRTNGSGAPSNIVNWDDTDISTSGVTPSNPVKTGTDGLSSATNGHKWGSTSYNSIDFGDEVLLDTWAYVLSAPLTSSTIIAIKEADLETVSITPGATTICAGQPMTYTIVARNNGPDGITAGKYRIVYPAILTNVSVSTAVTGGAAVSGATTTTTQYDANVSMPNTATITFTVTGTISAAYAGGSLNVTASIMRQVDYTDPDATNPDPAGPTDPQNECDAAPSGVGCNNIKTSAVTVSPVPTTAVAGPAQVLCAATGTTLAGNTPTAGTGLWTKISGPGTQVITSPTSGSTTVSGLTTGAYVFRWTISSGNCTPSTSDVSITVQAALTGNSITAPATISFCGSGDPGLINGAVPSGGSGTYTYQWQSSTDNITFTNIGAATAQTYDPPALTATTYFRRLVTSGGCATPVASNVVTFTVQPAITGNTITAPANTVFCEFSDADVITGSAPAGGNGVYTYQWQSSLDNATWSDLSGAVSASYDPVRVGVTVYYRRLVSSGACTAPVASNVITVAVNPALTAGVVASAQTFCVNGDPAPFTQSTAATGGNNTYTYQWQRSTTSASSGFTDISGATAATYDAPAISQTSYYRRIVRSVSCSDAISNVLTITVNPLLTAGSIGNSQTFCASGDPVLLTEQTAPTGGNGTYTYRWQSSVTSASAGFTDIPNAVSASYDPSAVTQTTYFRRITASDNCGDAISNVVTITINPGIAGNTISSDQTICTGATPATINGAAPTGGNGVYTYLWESSTTGSAGFAPAAGINNTQNYTPAALTQSVIYRKTISSGACTGSVSNIISVSVTATAPVAAAGTDQGPLNATTVNLAGNNSGSGSGSWSQVSGPNTANFVNNIQPNTAVTNLVPGTYVFRWTISNGPCAPTADDVTIIINAPPVAGNDNAITDEDVPVIIAVGANDSDADGTIVSGELVDQPANGTLTLNADNTVTYTPNPDFNGTDVFTYIIKDNLGTVSNRATVTITVRAVNDAPIARNDNINVAEDVPVNLPAPGILDNDADVDGGQLAVSLVSTTTHGTLVLNSDGSLRYTPNLDFVGTDQFTYRVCDAFGLCATATVTFNVGNVNDAPVAANDTYTVAEDGILNAAPGVLANDADADNDPLTANLVTAPAHGTLTLNADGTFRYVPAADYNGPDQFTYSACDASGACSNATVFLNVTAVNDYPLATDDNFNMQEDQVLTFGVLFNDTDIDGDVLSAFILAPPASGNLVRNPDGTFNFTPAANFNGVVSFTYRVCDNGTPQLCDTANVIITVNPVNDPPVAANDTYTTPEDVPLSIAAPGVIANDTDIDSDVLTASVVTLPAHGSLSLNANGSFVYTPVSDYNGPDSYSYKICDAEGGCDTAVVNITVTSVNDRPVSQDASFSVDEDGILTLAAPGLLINDRDPDGDPLSAALLTAPLNGTAVINADGSFTYTPAANFNGVDVLRYLTCDNANPALCDTAVITINVLPVNDSPVSLNDTYPLTEDVPFTIPAPGVLGNDSDPDGDALTASVVAGPLHGSLTLNADGSFGYVPNANYNGTDSYIYRTCDGSGTCDTATVTLIINAANDKPEAGDDNYSAVEDVPLTIAAPGVMFNDVDADGDALTVTLLTQPASGSVALNANGSFIYTPAANFNGAVNFTYRVCDAAGLCDTAVANIIVAAVNDAPVGTNDTYTLNEDTPLNISAPGLLANDTDTDGDPLTTALLTQPARGVIVVNPDGSFTYTPTPDFNGADAFTYTVCDGSGGCDTVTVNLNVTAVNDAPAPVNDTYTATEDEPLTIAGPGVLFNDVDIDGDPLTASVLTQPANGTIVINPDGSFVYTPNANFNGTDVITYQACDNSNPQSCTTGTITITVKAASDAPVAVNDAITVVEDQPFTLPAPGLLGNDTDADGDQLSAGVFSQPLHGRVTVNPDGSLVYTPDADYNGTDRFTYQVCDNSTPSLCDTATVFITVTAVNDAPRPADDNYSVAEDNTLTIPATGVLLNDREPDGEAITAAVAVAPANGSLTLNANGSFSYTPNANFNGIDSFTYRACDPAGNCSTAIARIVVTASNDIPVAAADAFVLDEDVPLVISHAQLTANDNDPDGDPLTVSVTAAPLNGRLTDNGNGSFTYVPNRDYNGPDQFSYSVCDPLGACATAVVTLTVNAVNDTVIARNDEFKTPEDVPVDITFAQILANDFDVENEPLTITILTSPKTGTLVPQAGGFRYTPGLDVITLDSVTYKVCEPNGTACDTATIYFRIDDVNDPPVAADNAYAVNEDTRLVVAAPGALTGSLDPDDVLLSASLAVAPANGTVVFRADGSFEYTPNINFNGHDKFAFNVCDGSGACDSATVFINVLPVNDKPLAVNDNVSGNEDAPVSGNVITNDTDLDGDALTVSLVAAPSSGSLVLNADGTFTYTPAQDFNGTDVFTYQVCDNGTPGLCDTATVTITVAAVNDVPVANNDSYELDEDTDLIVPARGVMNNDADADDEIVSTVLQAPANGRLELQLNGSFKYRPNPDFNGNDSFTYQACDVNGACATATVSLLIKPVNDAPVAVNDTITLNEEQVVVLDPANPALILVNDYDADGDALTATPIGSLTNGTLVRNPNGTYTYTPAQDFAGVDYIAYQLCDNGTPSLCDTAFVYIRLVDVNDPPVAVADSFAIAEDNVLAVPAATGVLANDTDPDGEVLVATLVTTTNGRLTLAANGSFEYLPNTNFNGVDSFTYRACDVSGACSTAVAKIIVTPVNDPPVGVDDYFVRAEDTVITFPAAVALINDTDPDGDVLTGRPIGSLTKGTFTDNGNGTYTYRPLKDFNGVDSIEYQVCDPAGLCDTAIIRLTIEPRNDAPIANPLTYAMKEDSVLVIPAPGVLSNDSDPDGDDVVATLLTGPRNGTVTLSSSGSFTYRPARNFNGLDSISYSSCDIYGACDSSVVYINVAPVNDPPVPIGVTYTTNEDVALNIPAPGILAGDTDPDGDVLTARVSKAPEHGNLVLNADGSFTYTPTLNFNGNDQFEYESCDGEFCVPATIFIRVLPQVDAPVAVNDTFNLQEDSVYRNNAGVLINDNNQDEGPLNVTVVTAPLKGTLTLSGTGAVEYRPRLNANGADSAVYRICDQQNNCSNAKIYFNIAPVNDPPVGVDDYFVRTEDTVITFPAAVALINDTDPDGDVLSGRPIGSLTKGTFTDNGNGTYTYRPLKDFNGVDSIEYQVCDPGGLCDTAIIRVMILPVNDKPVAVDDAYQTQEDVALSVQYPALLGNDSDADNDDLNSAVLDGPNHGTLTINRDNSFTYIPAPNYFGTDTFTYIVRDPGGLMDTGRVIITINSVNDAPVALDNAYSLNENENVSANLIRNARDVDNNALTASVVTGPANGTLTLNPDGSFTYTPKAGYSGRDSALYRICDNGTPVLCDTAKLSFIINDVNGKPVATDDGYATSINTTLDVPAPGFLANDTDEGTLSITILKQPVNGAFTLNPDNSFRYIPDPNYTGADSLVYRICDNGIPSLCDTATVRFTINPAVAAPLIGVAKTVSAPNLEIDGSYTFTYTFIVRNMGNTPLTAISLNDRLDQVFTAPARFRKVGDIRTTGSLAANQAFDGGTNPNLLTPASSTLAAGRQDTVTLVLSVQPNKAFGTFNNTATAIATGAGVQVTDISTNSNLVDPDNNGQPSENDPTPVVLSPTKLRIPQGFSPNGDAINDRFVIGNVGADVIHLEVYNRWGNLVYRSADYKNDWNGKCNQGIRIGDDLPDGTYYYIILNKTTGEKYVSYITIMR